MHLLAWTILLGLPVYFFKQWQVGKDFIWFYYINTLISGLLFYSNYLILVPRYFFKIKKYRYYISIVALLVFFYLLSDISNELVFKYVPGQIIPERPRIRMQERVPPPVRVFGSPPFSPVHLFSFTFNSLFLVFFSVGLRVLERQSEIEKNREKMEREKLNSELMFLKNQISPHFFFNTLNNIYTLIGISTDDSQTAVLKLSKLMRYLLYESDQGNTMLSNEIDFMNNYIDLMKLRMSDKISLNVRFPDKYKDFSIPPLLFVPFIENAFKHGISYREKSFIDINMDVSGNSITFKCSNSLVKSNDTAKKNYSGIGLENAEKRLNLLFPGRHELKIMKDSSKFDVLLFINFA